MDQQPESQALSKLDLCTIAIAAGVLPPDGEMTPELVEYTRTIGCHAASVVHGYTDEDGDGNASDAILAAFALG